MSLVSLPELLDHAGKNRYAVGYFESWDIYSLEATIAAAEASQSPVIIGIGGLSSNHEWLQSGGIELYGAASRALADRAKVPVATLFNEADSFAEAAGGLGAGFNSVMMHTQGWDQNKLIADTAALVAAAHAVNVAVEGEIGALAEIKDGVLDAAGASYTTPEAAELFVRETNVDCLAVAVGNVHFVTGGHVPTVQVDLIKEIGNTVDVPLVLHGGSGTPDDQTRQAVEAGITKVNVGTKLKHVFGQALLAELGRPVEDPNLVFGSRFEGDANSRAGVALRKEIQRLMDVFGSTGQAGR
ncbi:class II fructose-bisphosphate aldolase [Arthrobacter globiformis]|uniref:class II fructose-bisphosphate aldolase n=1 Tax=Arthrobacter globiformis TaxID=1665 RepID=UPI0027820327|nr:class II fructose-bisphosphate aldolase [Arthrobacter globiformis]MDQ0864564.1 ketose-bisphosphate aldolase [Arthrobacter globiformis]